MIFVVDEEAYYFVETNWKGEKSMEGSTLANEKAGLTQCKDLSFVVHKKSCRSYDWSKEFKVLFQENFAIKYSHLKESHNLLINQQPERDESSIFDAAWATLKGKPWQCSSEPCDESW